MADRNSSVLSDCIVKMVGQNTSGLVQLLFPRKALAENKGYLKLLIQELFLKSSCYT
jgi:hypothetical protein